MEIGYIAVQGILQELWSGKFRFVLEINKMTSEEKPKLKEITIIIVLFTAFIVGTYVFMSVLSTSDYVENILIENIDNAEYWCEIKQDVPNNLYTGDIFSKRARVVTLLTTANLTDDAWERIQEHYISKLKELPCYDLWIEKHNNVGDVK